jgi:protein-tyrosine phosphatase
MEDAPNCVFKFLRGGSLWIGGYPTKDTYAQHNIHAVVSMSYNEKHLPPPVDMPWLCIPNLMDHPDEDITKYFDVTAAFIEKWAEEGQKNVLIHCAKGISRSVTIVINYLVKKRYAFTSRGALEIIRIARPRAKPNPGFMLQLLTVWGK